MRTTFRIIACAVGLAFSLQCPGDKIFSKGELSTTKNHTGNVWLKELNAGDSTFDYALAVATFEAGGKAGLAQPSRWSNPAYSGRHWLLSGKRTANTNCPQRGCNQVSSRRRALARCIADQRLYLSGNYTDPKGKAVWLEPVTDKDYHGVKENVPTPKRFSVAAM